MKDNFSPYQRAKLLLRYLRDELDENEFTELQAWLVEHPEQRVFVDRLLSERGMEENYTFLSGVEQPEAWELLKKQIGVVAEDAVADNGSVQETGSKTIRLWPRFRRVVGIVAAIAAIVFGVWFFYTGNLIVNHNSQIVTQNDIAPGSNKATIILANGKIINLSDEKTGVVIRNDKLAYNDGTDVASSLRDEVKQSSDEIASSRNAPRNEGKVQTLTASTPRGGTYQVTLPDGTRIWLNADSKISFPSQFIGKQRKVLLLNGEAYFEVAKNKARPFIVQTDKQEVEVLGTHFNINLYNDEANIKTTLLEGSIKVSQTASHNSRLLVPGQQSLLSNNSIKVQQADVEEAVSWKDGYFKFNDERIESIMKKIARWYDIDVQYQGKISDEEFKGTISRFKNISEVLSLLESTKTVHFKVEGRRVIVMQ